MKANEAPEKIYIPTILAANTVRYKEEGSIEYTRTDAFIEKACSWLKNHYRDYMYNPTGEKLEAFFGRDMIIDLKQAINDE